MNPLYSWQGNLQQNAMQPQSMMRPHQGMGWQQLGNLQPQYPHMGQGMQGNQLWGQMQGNQAFGQNQGNFAFGQNQGQGNPPWQAFQQPEGQVPPGLEDMTEEERQAFLAHMQSMQAQHGFQNSPLYQGSLPQQAQATLPPQASPFMTPTPPVGQPNYANRYMAQHPDVAMPNRPELLARNQGR